VTHPAATECTVCGVFTHQWHILQLQSVLAAVCSHTSDTSCSYRVYWLRCVHTLVTHPAVTECTGCGVFTHQWHILQLQSVLAAVCSNTSDTSCSKWKRI